MKSGRDVRPVVEAILAHPDVYDASRRMVKPPVVQCAGMLRAVGRGIDTATFRARWQMAQYICEPARLDRDAATAPAEPAALVNEAAAFLGSPALSGPVRAGLEQYAAETLAAADQSWKKKTYPVLALNALRMLVATSPDYLTS